MLLNSFYAFTATLGFAILFNIKGKNVFFVSLGGGIGWLFYLLCLNFKFSNTFALFVASIIVGIYSETMARFRKSPVTTFVVSALIPLVPGNGMYYTMYESVSGNASKALTTGIHTFASAGALAAGIILVSSSTKFIFIKKSSKAAYKS